VTIQKKTYKKNREKRGPWWSSKGEDEERSIAATLTVGGSDLMAGIRTVGIGRLTKTKKGSKATVKSLHDRIPVNQREIGKRYLMQEGGQRPYRPQEIQFYPC